ncbi:hypothetical protein B0H16DRAFT_1544608 [Mycena metata]|uniref:Uncharacterized protein n=1 Tax=Mycena metata TaxID=1033252 RepID=A0AAD7NBB4_9AGAR|nr:hypothetical protein B0H16DRAFT_1544608 [Mycena metata]
METLGRRAQPVEVPGWGVPVRPNPAPSHSIPTQSRPLPAPFLHAPPPAVPRSSPIAHPHSSSSDCGLGRRVCCWSCRRGSGESPVSVVVQSKLALESLEAEVEALVVELEVEAPLMLACRDANSRNITSFSAGLSACTVCACCRGFSRRENRLEQW